MKLWTGLGLALAVSLLSACKAGTSLAGPGGTSAITMTVADIAYPVSGPLTFKGPSTGRSLQIDQGATGANRVTLLMIVPANSSRTLVEGLFSQNDVVMSPQITAGGKSLRINLETDVLNLTSVTGALSGTYTGTGVLFDPASQIPTLGPIVPFAVQFSVPFAVLDREIIHGPGGQFGSIGAALFKLFA